MDQKLQELQRILDSDPENVSAKVQYLKLKVRITGEKDLLLKPLLEKQVWKGTPDPIQDLAIQEVASRLGKDWKLVGNETFSFIEEKMSLKQTPNGITNVSSKKTISQRIAFLEYKEEGVFNLIPGGSIRSTCCRNESCQMCHGNGYIFKSFYPRLVKQKPVATNWTLAKEWCDKNNFKLPSSIYYEYFMKGGKEDLESGTKNSFGLLSLSDKRMLPFSYEWTDWAYYVAEERELRAVSTRLGSSNTISQMGRLVADDFDNYYGVLVTRPFFEIPGLKD
jgi:hypothetical protein